MRKALLVGIDYYANSTGLVGCVNDARAVQRVLERNSDGTVNFGVKSLVATGPGAVVTRLELWSQIQQLFADESDIALFYFSGHGHMEATGGYVLASDARTGADGVPLADVLTFANRSPARNRVIMLDSCHSGIAGESPTTPASAELKEGTTILTASTAQQYATEVNGEGVFTNLLVDALDGAAGNLVGDVTPGSVYAHIDQSLGPWDQRPVFKTNVKSFVSLRKVSPPISLPDLQRITEFFPSPEYELPLDPSYEPERSYPLTTNIAPDPRHTAVFSILQKYSRVNLVVPVDAPHMWHAAMNAKSCKLTVLGRHYWRLVTNERI